MSPEDYIRRTFELARQGLGRTFPNPMVGAVVVKNGRVIGTGYHHQCGLDHAELDALKNCTESPEGATVYVNLEPCCHTNKQTPPCAQRLITEKVKKVVICNLDPNPSVNGKGVELLRNHGIEVESGVLASEGEVLNEVFFHAQRTKRPFVHLKLATTLDGRIAMPNGDSKWITGPAAREEVHKLRAGSQAVLAGAETIRSDDPKLNVRLETFTGEQPLRVIFSRRGILPGAAQVFQDELKGRTLLYTQTESHAPLPAAHVIRVNSLEEALQDLYSRRLIALFLEGGPTLATEFLKAKFVNRVSLFMNPSFLGIGKTAVLDFGLNDLNERPRLTGVESRWIDGDLLVSGRLN